MENPSFWTELASIWWECLENEITRGIIFGGIGGLMAIPFVYLIRLMRHIRIIPEGQRQAIVVFLCLFGGAALAAAGVMDRSHGIHLGMETAIIVGVYKIK